MRNFESKFEVFIKKHYKKFVIFLFVSLLGAMSVSYVPVNSVGTKINTIDGVVYDEPLQSGIQFKIPFVEKISYVSTELRSADIDDMTITTKDAQSLTIDIEMQYRIDPSKAPDTYRQFKSVQEEDWIEVFVYQRIQRGVQEAASQYTIIELMGEQRGMFQADVDKAVALALESNYMLVHSTSVDDMKASASILQSIEENAKQRQAVVTAQQKQEEEKVKNETNIAKAEADAKVKQIQAEAEAEANRKLAESINDNLIKYKEAEAREKHGWYKYNNVNPKIMEND